MSAEPVSPELALVDPDLRRRLLAAPPPARPTAVPRPAQPSVDVRRDRRGFIRSSPALVLALVLPLVLAAAGSASGRMAAGRAHEAAAAAVAAIHGNTASLFAWGPVAGASAYEVEIRSDQAVVFSARTRAPRVRIPARLAPGTYRWYVWPLRAGAVRKAAAAVVASSFVVSR
jgi:hypothetical protein